MKPSRIIKYKYSSLSGKIPSNKNNRTHTFESSLEKDFITLLEFDNNVIEYVEQPVKIEYLDQEKKRVYYPDVMVKYIKKGNHTTTFETILYEVKYSQYLLKHSSDLQPKFNAASAYAKSKGWEFRVVTDNEIRTDYLENVRFLQRYRKYEGYHQYDFDLMLNTITMLDYTTPEELILIAAKDWNKRAELIYLLWHMVANNYIQCNLAFKLTMNSEIWPNLNP